MSQPPLLLQFTEADFMAIDNALAVLEEKFTPLLQLSPEQRQIFSQMRAKTEALLYEQALVVVALNPEILPSNLAPEEAADADLVGIDKLRLRVHRLRELMDKLDDSKMVPGDPV